MRSLTTATVLLFLAGPIFVGDSSVLLAGKPKATLQDNAKALLGSWDLESQPKTAVPYVLTIGQKRFFLAMPENPLSPWHTSIDAKYKLVEQGNKRYIEFLDPKQPEALKQVLPRWQQDPDLASVRDPAGLAKLPAAERVEWQKFWADVAGLAGGP